MSKPFIVWTFRRSGGTNLAQAIFDASEFECIEHEPFNIDRVFGYIINSYEQNQDIDLARKKVQKVLSEKINIKHCLEIIPPEINSLILEESIKLGYKHMFLYREQSTNRLLSLNYAMKTDIWGGNDRLKVELNDIDYSDPVDVDFFLHHEEHCRREMWRIYRYLVDIGEKPVSVSFEMLYQSDFIYSGMLVKDIFSYFELNQDVITIDFLKKILYGGGQGTKSDYLRFPGAVTLQKKSSGMSDFKLNGYRKLNPDLKILSDNVLHVEFWKPMSAVLPKEYHFHGVIVLKNNCDILLFESNGNLPLTYRLKSDRMNEIYPDVIGSKNSRFISSSTALGGNFYIEDAKTKEKLVEMSY